MAVSRKNGMRGIGLMFLAVGVFKFLGDGGWVVWFILAFLFGAFSGIGGNKDEAGEA